MSPEREVPPFDAGIIKNLSGRTLHRLPLLSLATYARHDPCPMDEALGVLARAVEDELMTNRKTKPEREGSPNFGKRRHISLI